MLSRDFVQAFLIGQVQAGVPEKTAKDNFLTWVQTQNESIATNQDKEAIASDLASYSVPDK